MPKSTRAVTNLAWHPVDPNMIAVGYTRARNDCGIVLWDAFYTSGLLENQLSTMGSGRPVGKSNIDMAFNEGCDSFSWFPHKPGSLVCGLSHKMIRIYDLRGNIIDS